MMVLLAALLSLIPLEEDPAFIEGRRLYEASEYEQAVFRLQRAALIEDRTPAERAEVFMWLGLAYAGFGDAGAARRAFSDAMRIEPTIHAPIEISPKVEAEIEAVRAETKSAHAQPRVAPSTPPAEVSGASDGPPWAILVGTGALGVVCVVGGAVAAGFAWSSDQIVKDLDSFQDDAARAQDERDVQVVTASVLFGVGAVLVGGGAALWFATLPE
jgi:tetratricopeptide (TPR) repeat protein